MTDLEQIDNQRRAAIERVNRAETELDEAKREKSRLDSARKMAARQRGEEERRRHREAELRKLEKEANGAWRTLRYPRGVRKALLDLGITRQVAVFRIEDAYYAFSDGGVARALLRDNPGLDFREVGTVQVQSIGTLARSLAAVDPDSEIIGRLAEDKRDLLSRRRAEQATRLAAENTRRNQQRRYGAVVAAERGED